MPRLIRFYILNCLIGFGAAAVFVGMLLWFDIGHLARLILNSERGWLALLCLWIANGIVFAGVQFAIAIMFKGDDDDHGPGGGGRRRRVPRQPLRPAFIRATANSGSNSRANSASNSRANSASSSRANSHHKSPRD